MLNSIKMVFKPSMIHGREFERINIIHLDSSAFFTMLDILTMCMENYNTFNNLVTISNVMKYTGLDRMQARTTLHRFEELGYIDYVEWEHYKLTDKFFIELIPIIKFKEGEELCK